jgi:hypothetical protein
MNLRYLLAALLLAATLPAIADDAAAPTVNNMSVQEFLAWHDGVAKRATTKDFEALSRGDKEKLAGAQSQIREALAGKASMADLDEDTKVKVFNAHEQVVALVNKAEDQRLVCTQKKRIGSNRHQLECRTVAQIRADRDSARDSRLRTGTCDSRFGACGGG